MPALLYACVSTEAQEKQQTIDSQVAELRRYAEAQGLIIEREFIDDGYSGTMLERPGLPLPRPPILDPPAPGTSSSVARVTARVGRAATPGTTSDVLPSWSGLLPGLVHLPSRMPQLLDRPDSQCSRDCPRVVPGGNGVRTRSPSCARPPRASRSQPEEPDPLTTHGPSHGGTSTHREGVWQGLAEATGRSRRLVLRLGEVPEPERT